MFRTFFLLRNWKFFQSWQFSEKERSFIESVYSAGETLPYLSIFVWPIFKINMKKTRAENSLKTINTFDVSRKAKKTLHTFTPLRASFSLLLWLNNSKYFQYGISSFGRKRKKLGQFSDAYSSCWMSDFFDHFKSVHHFKCLTIFYQKILSPFQKFGLFDAWNEIFFAWHKKIPAKINL